MSVDSGCCDKACGAEDKPLPTGIVIKQCIEWSLFLSIALKPGSTNMSTSENPNTRKVELFSSILFILLTNRPERLQYTMALRTTVQIHECKPDMCFETVEHINLVKLLATRDVKLSAF